MNEKQPLIVVLGPTASGKTRLGVELAKKLHTEVISGDSMLVYRGFDIGTAKPSLNEQDGVVHHLIDVLDPAADYNVTEFKAAAEQKIKFLNSRGKIPLLVGGTGLYAKSILEGYQFNETAGDPGYRQYLEKLAEEKGKEYVHDLLKTVDPQTADRLHVNDFRRVVRALEVCHLGKETISQKKRGSEELAFQAVVAGLTMDRQLLYKRINRRVDDMIKTGLVQEVEALLNAGVPEHCQAMKGIGYKEIIAHLKGEISLETATEEIKKATRHFAKRQITWFKKMPYIKWYHADKESSADIVEKVYNEVQENL